MFMSDKDNKIQDLEIIQVKINQLFAAYKELKNLNDEDAYEETLREGFLLKAGKNTEKILKYICKKEEIVVTPKPLTGKATDTRIPMLNDYIFHLKEKKIINEDIHHHLEIIKKWRNRSAHDFSEYNLTVDTIKDSTIESVNDSFTHLKDWFFIHYLKGEYADFSKNTYTQENNRTISDKPQGPYPLTIPDNNILIENKATSNKSRYTVFLLTIICLVSVYSIYHFYIKESFSNDQNVPIPAKTHLNKDQVYVFLIEYFNSNNNKNSDAHQYFANKVSHFYLQHDLNPTQIDIIRQTNIEYIDNKNSIDKESLYLFSKNDSISFWRFWTEYTCYRTSKKQFQNCKVLMEFGINTARKITAIKQIDYTTPRYSRKKPR
jgi:hypothetical protein